MKTITPTTVSRWIQLSAWIAIVVGITVGCICNIPGLTNVAILNPQLNYTYLMWAAGFFLLASTLYTIFYLRARHDGEIIYKITAHPTPQFNAVLCFAVAFAFILVIIVK
jgi:hypothetical protein